MATYYVRTDGNDSNTGTGPATNQAWQTITKAIGATGIAPGDTLYIAPGVYRGVFTAAFTNPTSEGQRIIIAGNPTASQFSGVNAGPVIITNFTTNTAATNGNIVTIFKDFVTLQDINIISTNPGGSPYYMIIKANGTKINFTRCQFHQTTGSAELYGVDYSVKAGQAGGTISQCVLLGAEFNIYGESHSGTWDSQTLISDCIILNTNTNSFCNNGVRLTSLTSGQFGGLKIINCYISAQNGVKVAVAISTTFPAIVQNCYIEAATGISALSAGQIVQTYNLIQASNALANVSSSATTLTNVFASYNGSIGKIQGWGDYPFVSLLSSAQLGINAGINTNSPVSDIYGTTWFAPSTPTIGASEFQSYTPTGTYVPTERNASTITIAPGSTSQSIELYLGVTGLTASTSGLSARYNRTRTASVSIPLVARTIAQAWTAGGIAEVDATNMPGVYRLDLPDAALAAGADDVTIVVRGASGTNGAVMTVKLSSGGLTEAQTAGAVWNAVRSSYATAGTFGEYVNTNVNTGAIADAVWDEARSGHTTAGTFGQYVNAELVTPVSQAALVRMGPFEVRADGLGASDPLDIQKGAQHGIDIQCVDNNGAGIDITSATVTAKVYNSGATLVDTYSCTATYAADGRATFTIDTTVTNTPGTYTATITRTTGASDTQIFGPLRIYVRDI
jgi:hypothetical protein